MDTKTISVCLIVKNEENNLSRCLKSIEHIADEIIVVDTGSTDNSIEVAKNLGAKVIEYEWKNDFSDARNKSLEHATKDWILFLDADEEIPYEDGIKFKTIINEPKNKIFEGYYVRLVNIVDNRQLGDSIVFRAFKNDPDYRFVGKMHEQVIRSVQDKCGDQSVGSTDIKILHYGYDPNLFDQMKKSERNIGLLLSYEEKDKDGYYYYALGNEYMRIGQLDTALETFNKAIDCTNIVNGSMPIYYPYLMVSLMNLLHPQRRYKEEFDYIQIFKRTCRDFKDLHFFEGLIYIERNCFSKGYKSLSKHLECGQIKSNYTYPSNNFEQYNIPDIMNQLKTARVEHDDDLISSIIICDKFTQTITETLKSLNEISREVVVAIPNNIDIDTVELENLGAIIIRTLSCNEDEMYFECLNKCRGKYILKIHLGEIFSAQAQRDIVELLINNKKDILQVQIINMQNQLLYNQVRIYKNNKRFKKYNDLIKHIQSKKVEETDLKIHLLYDVTQETQQPDISLNETTQNGPIINNVNQNITQNKKILIGSVIDTNMKDTEEFLTSLNTLNHEGFELSYYFINNTKDKDASACIDEIGKDTLNVFVQNANNLNSKSYKNEILNYAMANQSDYLLLLNPSTKVTQTTLYELASYEKDIVVSPPINENSQNKIMLVTRNAMVSGVNFEKISVLPNVDDVLNLCIKSELFEFEIFEC